MWSWEESGPWLTAQVPRARKVWKQLWISLSQLVSLGNGKTIPKICREGSERLTIFPLEEGQVPREPSRHSRLFSRLLLQLSFKSHNLFKPLFPPQKNGNDKFLHDSYYDHTMKGLCIPLKLSLALSKRCRDNCYCYYYIYQTASSSLLREFISDVISSCLFRNEVICQQPKGRLS